MKKTKKTASLPQIRSKQLRVRTAKDKAADAVVVYVEHGYASFAEGPVDVVVCDFDIQDEEPQDITVNGRRCRLSHFPTRRLSRAGKRVLKAARDNSCTVDGYLC